MKILRRLLLFVFLPLALVIGLVALRDPFLARAIAAAGTEALGVETTVDGVSTALVDGRFELRGLVAQNPPGFSAAPFLDFGGLETEMPLTRLRDDPLAIEAVVISDVKLRVERRGTALNLEPIKARIDELSASAGPSAPAAAPAPEAQSSLAEPAAPGRVILVRRIELVGTTVVLDLGEPWLEARELNLPTIVLEDVQASGDDALAKIIGQVVERLIEGALGEVGDLPAELAPVLDALRNGLAEGLEAGDLGAGLDAAMADLEGAGQELLDQAVQTGLDELGTQATDLLGQEGAAALEGLVPEGVQEEAAEKLGGLLKGLSGGDGR